MSRRLIPALGSLGAAALMVGMPFAGIASASAAPAVTPATLGYGSAAPTVTSAMVGHATNAKPAISSAIGAVNAKVVMPMVGRAPNVQPDTNMTYHGGPIQKNPRVYLIFWGFGTDPSGEATRLQNFFSGLGGSTWDNTVTNYFENSRGFATNPTGQLGGVWFDNTNPVPATPSDANVAAEAVAGVSHFGYYADANYFVATPTGHTTISTFDSGACAWHSTTNSASGAIAYTNFSYQTDAGAGCGANFVNAGSAGTDDGITIVAGHEYAEAQTDPLMNGWYDTNFSGEIGDKCAWIRSGQGAATNLSLSTGSFAVQSLWSNQFNVNAGGCITSYLSPASREVNVVRMHDGVTMSLLARGQNGTAWYSTLNGSTQSAWTNLNLAVLGAPTGVWNAAGTLLDVFAIGANHEPYHATYSTTSGWSAWTALPGLAGGNTGEQYINVVMYPGGSHENIFVTGTNGNGYWSNFTGSTFGGWNNIGGSLKGAPTGVWNTAGTQLDVFAVGAYDDHVWQISWTSAGWTGWTQLAGIAGNGADEQVTSATFPGGSRADIMVLGTDRGGWYARMNNGGSSFGGFQGVGGVLLGAPTGSWNAAGTEFDLIGVGTNGQPFEDSYKTSTGTWTGWIQREGYIG